VQETRSLDRAQGGLGIGLTLVRTLVKMHGGSVRAFSEGPGRGSELVVRLPLAPQTRPSPAAPAPAARAGAGAALRDLILLDIGLPGMAGYEVAARLRAAGHTRAALVALTGYG